jgi:Flp pilus assembly protein TadG
METADKSIEKGQALVIIVIAIVALIGMLALIIDGGMAYANRRSAQNAADAGALAGATELCKGNGITAATNQALDYAVNKNKATSALIVPDLNNMKIGVTASFQYNTFFANILNRPVMTVTASADAGCYKPCTGVGVLPVSWSCQRPVQGSPSGLNACGVKTYTTDPTDPSYTEKPDSIYIVMDNSKALGNVHSSGNYCQDAQTCYTQGYSSTACTSSGAVLCDWNHDGINENITPGDTGWLNLDGGSGNAAILKSWVTPPFFQGTLRIDSWMQGITGAVNNLYTLIRQNIEEPGLIVLVPVFDDVCAGNGLPENTCPSQYNSNDITIPGTGTGNGYVEISNFSAFKITCVYEGKNKEYPISPWTQCDAAHDFLNANPSINPSQYNSIEGFFVSDYQYNFSGNCGVCDSVSPCTIYLNK